MQFVQRNWLSRAILLTLIFTLSHFINVNLRAETLHLTSLHWPPYTSQSLHNQGACVVIVREALKVMGHQLDVDFYPWSRAKKLVKMPSSQYMGYFPAYSYSTNEYVFSDAFASSPLGLVERTSSPIRWTKISDLNKYNLGVVAGYVNTQQLDQMITERFQPAEIATSDTHNLQKVAAARVDAAVIDVHVFHYLLKGRQFESTKNKLQMNSHLLAEKQLYIGFRNTPEGKRWRDILNAGLAKISPEELLKQHLPKS